MERHAPLCALLPVASWTTVPSETQAEPRATRAVGLSSKIPGLPSLSHILTSGMMVLIGPEAKPAAKRTDVTQFDPTVPGF